MTDSDDGAEGWTESDPTHVPVVESVELPAAGPVDPGAPPGWWTPLPQIDRSPRLGRNAMFISFSVFVLSGLASVLIGLYASVVYQYAGGFNARPNSDAFLAQMLLGSAFGIWAFVQGIVATARNRGRKYGIVAIVVASCAPIASLIIFTVVVLNFGHAVSTQPFVNTML